LDIADPEPLLIHRKSHKGGKAPFTTYVKVRRDHRIVCVAVVVAVGVNTDGRREVLGVTTGDSEAEPFWTEFLRRLRHRGLRGVKLVVSEAHDGRKAAITRC
jgi:transposase-like protein